MKKEKTNSKKRKEQKDEEGLEEEISEEETKNIIREITENRLEEGSIDNFLLQIDIKAPVLERIANQEAIPTFNQFETQQERERDDRGINYAVSNEPEYNAGRNIREQEDKKYETTFVPPVLTQKESFGRTGEFFTPMRSAWEEAREISETPQEFGALEMEKRRLPFEEEQKKYKKVKF